MSYIDKINVNDEEYQLVGSGEMLPVGTELDIDKDAEIPFGWEEIEYDTGWVNLTLASNVTVREPSPSEDYTPAIRRIGNVVSIRGEIDITQLPLKASSEIFINIPSGFIPTLHNIKCFNKDIYSTLNNTSTIYYWKGDQYTTTISASGMWVLDELTTKRIRKVSETQVPSIGEIYDDQERVIGTWFGKPLYRKVIVKTVAEIKELSKDSANRYLLPVQDLNIDLLMEAKTICEYDDGGSNIHHKKCYSSVPSSSAYDMTILGINNGYILCRYTDNILNYVTSNIYIPVEYTKTTD